MRRQSIEDPLLGSHEFKDRKSWGRPLYIFLAFLIISIVGLVLLGGSSSYSARWEETEIVESERGVVAADDGRCSEVGASMLRKGGHAVDAAVATGLCLGVVNSMSSGIGGGAFMVVLSSRSSKADAFDMRETAPAAASEGMYEKNPQAKYLGALSMGVPGELAGLYEAWLKYGRLPWKILFEPAVKFAKNGFIIAPYLAHDIALKGDMIMADPGLSQVFAPNGKLLQAGDTCYNVQLAHSLEAVAEQGPQAFYNGVVGEKLVKDVKEAGGILTMEDLRNYKVQVTEALAVDVMGYKVLGMPPPSSGTVGLSLVLNILASYGSPSAAAGPLGLHRLIEAMKHMLAIRMNLGDPAFVDVTKYVSDMTSPTFAEQIRHRIYDNTTFPPDYYLSKWSQLRDNGTSHFCIVDAERNAVSVTTTVNYVFGAGVLSPNTGIVLNNEMDDFSVPGEITPDKLPPAPANFIRPGKRPLSSMTPLVILKDNQLVGVVGGSGGLLILGAVIQVFLNNFVLGMDPLAAVQNPRVYPTLVPNYVKYENWTVIDGSHIELSEEMKVFLEERGHQLVALAGGAITQLVVQTLESPIDLGRKNGRAFDALVYLGSLTAVSDPRKGGRPAAM